MLDIVPLFSRIIVKRKDVEKIGTIIIPDTATSMKATEGEVVAIGKEVDSVKVGEKVYWGKYSGSSFERGNTEYIFMNEDDLLGIINPYREGK